MFAQSYIQVEIENSFFFFEILIFSWFDEKVITRCCYFLWFRFLFVSHSGGYLFYLEIWVRSAWLVTGSLVISLVSLWSFSEYLGKVLVILDPRFYPRGSLVIALVRPLVHRSIIPSLNISETVHWIFLILCMKLGHHKGTEVTESDFWKKIFGGSQMGETPHFWGIFDVFCPYLCIQSLKVSEISYTL